MPRKEFAESGYVAMYLLVYFDLPVKTKKDRKEYALFRKALLKNGFTMLQYSVYSRYCADNRVLEQHKKRVREALPPKGHVRTMAVTSKIYEKMERFIGRKEVEGEKEPDVVTFY